MAKRPRISTATEIDYIQNITTQQARDYVNKQIKKANNQLYKIEKADVFSPAYQRAISDIGRDTNRWRSLPKDATDQQILQRYAEVLDFMKSPSYSIRESKKEEKRVREQLEEMGEDFTKEQLHDLFQVLHSKEYGRATRDGNLDSKIAYNEIVEAISYGAGIEEIKSALQEHAQAKLDISDFQERVTNPDKFLR